MDSIIGHQEIKKYLQKAQATSQLAHAYLLSGPTKTGKQGLALKFCKQILNSSLTNNPDFLLIPRLETSIKIDEIRTVKQFFAKKPFSHKYKVALIVDAERMLESAQNSLLKTLEEPAGHSLLILTSSRPELLLPTIRSRVEEIRLSRVSGGEMRDFLRKQNTSESQTRLLLKQSAGLPGKLIDILSSEDYNKSRQKVFGEFLNLSNASLVDKFNLAKQLSEKKEDLTFILNIYLSFFRDVLLTKLGTNDFLVNEDFREQINDISNQNTLEETKQKIELIIKTKKRLALNVNPRLSLEAMWLEL